MSERVCVCVLVRTYVCVFLKNMLRKRLLSPGKCVNTSKGCFQARVHAREVAPLTSTRCGVGLKPHRLHTWLWHCVQLL